MKLNIVNLYKTEYEKALKIQLDLQQKIIDDELSDTFLIVEHPPVLTMGKRASQDNILASEKQLEKETIKTVWINRGGDVTYHGPGQMVGYPIINLLKNKLGIRAFVDNIQQAIIKYLKNEHGLIAEKKSGIHTGVWINEKKICAIGISVRRGVTLHGFAFNISTNLKHFDYINPCGLGFGMVTSLEEVIGHKTDFNKACLKVTEYLCKEFSAEPIYKNIEELI